MGFTLGGSASKGKSSGTETYDKNMTGASTNTATGTAPDWLQKYLQDSAGKTMALGATDPTSFIAGADPLQTMASAGAASLSGSPWNFDAAADLTRGVANSKVGNIADGIGANMSPYLKDVVDSTAADLDHSAGQVRAQQDLDLTGSGAFGGSGAALTKSATEGELSRARGTTLSGLKDQGFARAAALAAQDITNHLAQGDQRLAAGGQLAGLSTAYDTNNRANIEAQAAQGDKMRQIAQSFASAPLELQNWVSQNLPPELLQGLFGKTEVGTETGTESGNSKTTGKSSGVSFGGSVSGGK